MQTSAKRNNYVGAGLALLAVVIWSGNFVVARGVIHQLPPSALAFYRWITAAVIIFPFAFRDVKKDWPVIKKNLGFLCWVSLFGITLFNTGLYVGAHYTTAINLSLIGTTSSPIMAVILARIFLKERIDAMKMTGIAVCVAGVIFLLSRGSWENLTGFRFTQGDVWVLGAAFAFAVYNILVRKKPAGISPYSFLMMIFALGAIFLLPYYGWELAHQPPVHWNANLVWIIIYLGLGTSVISYICWNNAIARLGAGRTALFGNLIPVFSSVEAALILGEDFTWVHIVGMLLVFTGILIANWKIFR